MKPQIQILIGGQALRNLGHDRHTDDTDYLVNWSHTTEAFIREEGVDYINANGNKFFMAVWESLNGQTEATPQALAELKAYAFVQHCQNFNFKKADACEYDLRFLFREFSVKPTLVAKFVRPGEYAEILKSLK